jgi:hypothetical protein
MVRGNESFVIYIISSGNGGHLIYLIVIGYEGLVYIYIIARGNGGLLVYIILMGKWILLYIL